MKKETVLIVKGALSAVALLVAVNLFDGKNLISSTWLGVLILILMAGMWINGSK